MKLELNNAVIAGILSIFFLLIFGLLMSDPRTGQPIHFVIPGGTEFNLFACPFKSLTGIPCPFCGISRSTVLMLHGDLAGSFRAHPLGPLAVAAAVFLSLRLPFVIVRQERLSRSLTP